MLLLLLVVVVAVVAVVVAVAVVAVVVAVVAVVVACCCCPDYSFCGYLLRQSQCWKPKRHQKQGSADQLIDEQIINREIMTNQQQQSLTTAIEIP